MNIVFIINDLNYFVIHRQALAVAWLDLGWQVTVMAGQPSGAVQDLDPRLKVECLPFARHRFAFWKDVLCLRRISRIARPDRVDVVHAFTIKAVLLAGLSAILHRRKAGLVLTFAGLGKIFEPSDALWPRMRRMITTTLLRQIERYCRPWTTFENRQDHSRSIELGFASPDRSIVIQGAGIDLRRFKSPDRPRTGTLRIVMASRMIATKGVDTFIEAARRLKGKGTFTLTGPIDIEDVDAVREDVLVEAAEAGVVDWRGSTSIGDMGALFREHDVAVLPTRLKEGFPRSLLEAAACGCALIATRQDVIETIVRPGETGWLLREAKVDDLVHTLECAIRDPDATRLMGSKAAALVSSMKVDSASVIAKFQDVYMRSIDYRTDGGHHDG